MSKQVQYIPYRPKSIVNKAKRPDHWFWSRYSIHPYIGCQHGCAFCYSREEKYAPYDDIDEFSRIIKVKENAPDLVRRYLSKPSSPVDLVITGDYQPAEKIYNISRQILEVLNDLRFPVMLLERSPLALRDLDLVQSISQRAAAVVAFSVISTPDSPSYERVCKLERLAPPAEKRFEAMEQFARAGILTGACLMPVLPFISDDDQTLRSVVQWTADHGGKFVLAGGLTLSDQQRNYFLNVLKNDWPDLVDRYRNLYPEKSYGLSAGKWNKLALKIKSYCQQAGISDRMPRPIIPGDKKWLNKRIAEQLANRVYDMDIQNEPQYRIWAYRKAAWAIEELEQDIGLVYRSMGKKGLENITNVGPSLAGVVQQWIKEFTTNNGDPGSDTMNNGSLQGGLFDT
ncbi:MAG: hypothetical protein JXA42_17480 [Anaerolineales bacterium]|nr:hypothetical protein [Anaerolineales bacterium]